MERVEQPALAHSLRSRACDNCSRRKKKCDGGRPRCGLCRHGDTPCIYPRFSLKPGPKTGSSSLRRQKIALSSTVARSPSGNLRKRGSGDGDAVPLPTESLRPIISPKSQFLSSTTFIHDGTINHPYGLEEPSSSQSQCAADRSPSPEQLPQHDYMPDYLLPSQKLVSHLVDTFFAFINPQIHILHRPSFLTWIKDGHYASSTDSIFLISTISALAARFSDMLEVDLFDRSLLKHSRERHESLGDSFFRYSQRCQRGKGFLNQAHRLFRREILRMEKAEIETGTLQKPTIIFIQATALLTLAEIGMALSSRAYSLVSTSVRLAYDCGLDQIDGYQNKNISRPKFGSNDTGAAFVKREELRRVWWAISQMENFVSVTKCRPRLIDWNKCKTKLPSDDDDWFEERDVPSYFLPHSLDDIHASLDLPTHISTMGHRILIMHLFSKLAYLASNIEGVDGWQGPVLKIKECVAAWKPIVAKKIKSGPNVDSTLNLSDALVAYLLLLTSDIVICNIRVFKNATPYKIFSYYQDVSRGCSTMEHPLMTGIIPSPESKALLEALHASDSICATIRNQPTEITASMLFIPPLMSGAAWHLLLLVKSFPGTWPNLGDKASLCLKILTMEMEQSADIWGLGLYYLCGYIWAFTVETVIVIGLIMLITDTLLASFSKFEHQLTGQYAEEEEDRSDEISHISKHQYFPSFLDASFVTELSSIYALTDTSGLWLETEMDQQLQPAAPNGDQPLIMQPLGMFEDWTESVEYSLREFDYDRQDTNVPQ